MNKNTASSEWANIKAKLKKQWAELTDDDLEKIKADGQDVYGILQKKYGYAKNEVEEEVESILGKMSEASDELKKELDELKANFKDLKDQLTNQISHAVEQLPNVVQEGQKKIIQSVESHPLSAIALAVAVGVFLGSRYTGKSK